ncbi:MAG: serine hydrolase domain-containing protein [Gemmataceae bacterium]
MTATWIAATLIALAPADAPPLPDTLDTAKLDAFLAGHVREHGYVGLSVAVVRDGKPVFEKVYGKTYLPDGPAVTANTPFAIGSVTKQFACAAIFLLADDGRLSVYDKVSKWYPSLTRANDITLYDLMTHASGYADYYPLDFLDRRMKKSIPPDDLIREYAGGKLDFEPGSKWSYSNTGYTILGRVVEKVSGEPLGKFLERRIFKPCGMTQTKFEPDPLSPGLARGHTTFALGPQEPTPQEGMGWLNAAGGVYSTAADLCRWDMALADGKVLKPASLKLMTKPRELTSGKVPDYGCGLTVSRQGGELVLGHGGAVSGFLAQNAFIPRTKTAVVLLSNAENVDAGALHRRVFGLVLKEQESREQTVPVVKGPPAKDAAIELFKQMQAGTVDAAKLGEEFALFMSPERVKASAERLKALGEPKEVVVERLAERGGMEVAVVRFEFKTGGPVKANMFRSIDGKVQQFLLSKG